MADHPHGRVGRSPSYTRKQITGRKVPVESDKPSRKRGERKDFSVASEGLIFQTQKRSEKGCCTLDSPIREGGP
jgi:hypothetical protein